MKLDAGIQQAVKGRQSMGGMLADHVAPDLLVGRVEGDAQRRQALLEDTRLVLFGEVGQGHERTRQEAQAIVVVTQSQGRTKAVRQLAHEAKDAGVATLLDAVEDDAVEIQAPILALFAPKLHDALFPIKVDVGDVDLVLGAQPTPIDDVPEGLTVDGRHEDARLEPRIVSGAIRLYVLDAGKIHAAGGTFDIFSGILGHDLRGSSTG